MTEFNEDASPETDAVDESAVAIESTEDCEPRRNSKPTLGVRNGILFVCLLAIVLFGLLLPMPFRGPAADPLADLAHAPLFCALALGALGVLSVFFPRGANTNAGQLGMNPLRSDRSRKQKLAGFASGIGRSTLVFILLAVFGIAMEYLQRRVGRNASWGDVQANMVGSVAGILLFWGFDGRRRGIRGWWMAFPVLVSMGLLIWISIRPAMLLWNMIIGN